MSESAGSGSASWRTSSSNNCAIAGVGLSNVKGHGEPMRLLAPALDVIEAEQVPARLGDPRLEPQGVLPGCLGSFIPTDCRVRLPLVEHDDRLCAAVTRLDSREMLEGTLGLLFVAAEGDLCHQHVGLNIVRIDAKVVA